MAGLSAKETKGHYKQCCVTVHDQVKLGCGKFALRKRELDVLFFHVCVTDYGLIHGPKTHNIMTLVWH